MVKILLKVAEPIDNIENRLSLFLLGIYLEVGWLGHWLNVYLALLIVKQFQKTAAPISTPSSNV